MHCIEDIWIWVILVFLILVRSAKIQCETVIVSIFVNPSQFGVHEDLDKYPRTEAADIELLKRESADIVFIPTASEMYPSGISLHLDQQIGTFVSVLGLSHQL